jgi:hypothetical protein
MDQATLVNLDVNAGRKILDALDEAQIKVAVALWMISSDYEDWRLVLCLPTLDQTQMLKTYQKVADVARGRFAQMLPPILILPAKDTFIKELRRIFGKAKDVTGMRLGGQTIGNRYISDAYVYRIQK